MMKNISKVRNIGKVYPSKFHPLPGFRPTAMKECCISYNSEFWKTGSVKDVVGRRPDDGHCLNIYDEQEIRNNKAYQRAKNSSTLFS